MYSYSIFAKRKCHLRDKNSLSTSLTEENITPFPAERTQLYDLGTMKFCSDSSGGDEPRASIAGDGGSDEPAKRQWSDPSSNSSQGEASSSLLGVKTGQVRSDLTLPIS
uniref:Uncharacterized protein n=1 Tax=Oryza barthii TaxID=65489 RepID=A0A0D3F5H2_9ORYZ